jgi:hypothetical protein
LNHSDPPHDLALLRFCGLFGQGVNIMKLFGIGGKRAALATTATLALAIGMIATPQAANAEVCLMVRTGNQFE